MAWRPTVGMLAIGAALAAMTPVLPASAAPFTGLYVFGDSLTDTGNAHLGAVMLGLPSPAPPELGYFNGRLSNGPVWVDYLSQRLGAGLLEPQLLGGTNYSVAGARAVANADPSPDLAQQIGRFAGDLAGSAADPDALYVVNFGGNDARDILHDDTDAPDPAAVAPTIAAGVVALNGLGARNFLVAGIPNIGLQPEQNGEEAAGRALSLALDAALDAAIAALVLADDRRLFTFDYFSVSDPIEADPEALGFTQPLDLPCLGVPGASPACPGFLFFDPLHPSTAAHRLIADAVAAEVNIAEPPAIMLLGAGLVALAVRRRRS